ncbi:cytochrome c-type biogenesis protein [Roseobacteraceae bacterium S113]
MRRLALLLVLLAAPLWAVEPDEVLDDPILEERAREISKNVRCVVCQNEPIDSSNAQIARTLRILIRERLVAGDSDAQVEAFLVARYGDYVLFRPPFKPTTYALWIAPFALFALGGIGAAVAFSRRRGAQTGTLSAQEEAEADALLKAYSQDEEDPRP